MNKGFTLIELLVVIAIVAILSTVVMLTINPAQIYTRARTGVTRNNLNMLADHINKIKGFSGKSSLGITLSGCSECVCRDGNPVDLNSSCVNQWRTALSRFEAEGINLGIYNSLSDFTADGWGSPYLLDENEGEGGGCAKDSLFSAGPDKIRGNADDIYPYNTSNFIINVTPACSGT